jgi:hypothetical protein
MNTVQNATSANVIGGYSWNYVDPYVVGAAIGGGGHNGGRNEVYGNYATVGGGRINDARQDDDTVGGGASNTADGGDATVGGGEGNTAGAACAVVAGGCGNVASSTSATVAGGDVNYATAEGSTIGGGSGNSAGGSHATVPGGYDNNAAGSYSFAAGRQAQANYDGCFVWGDSSTTNDVACYGPNRTIFRNAGGIWIYTNAALSSGVRVAAGGSSWNAVSDRQAKENFRSVDAQMLLARLSEIPVSTWNYKAQDPSIRHIGPMAQDFNALLEDLGGEGETYINSLDADGIALAAIQGLYELGQEQAARIEALQAEKAAQDAEMEDLERRVSVLEQGAGATKQPPGTRAAATWLLLPGLVVVAGVVLQQRRSGGGR